jgi:hypothetical protein
MTAPTLVANTTGGTMHAGTYNVAYTYVYADGTESLPSASASATISTSTGSITVTAIANPGNGAIGYRLYISPAAGTNLLYQDTTGVQPFGGTNPVMTVQVATSGSASVLGARTVNTSVTSYQYPITTSVAGGTYLTTAGGRSTGEWQNLSQDLNYPPYTQGGSVAAATGCGRRSSRPPASPST